MSQGDSPTVSSYPLLTETLSSGRTRSLIARQGYNHLDNPKWRHYGKHGLEFEFLLQGKDCAVSFLLHTSWYPRTKAEKEGWPYSLSHQREAMSAPTGQFVSHSPVALYEGHDSYGGGKCEYTGGDCYGSVTYLSDDVMPFDDWICEPSLVWTTLEKRLDELEQKVAEQRSLERNFS